MPARTTKKVPPKPATAPTRTLRTTLMALISARIDFKVHYPTKNSMVITADGNLNQPQLRVFVEKGGAFGPGRQLMILIPKLSHDGE